MAKAKFSWKNYNAPTPQTYLRLAKLVKRILYGLSTASLFQEKHWVTFITIIAIPAVEELVQFFSDDAEAANVIHVEAEVGKDTIVVGPVKATGIQAQPKGPRQSVRQ